MAVPKGHWTEFFRGNPNPPKGAADREAEMQAQARHEAEMIQRQMRQMQELQQLQQLRNLRIDQGPLLAWDNVTWTNRGDMHTPGPDTTGEFMITLLPEKEEIDATELLHVRAFISDQAQGKKKSWPNFPVVLRVNGKGRFVQGGVWELPNGSNNIFVGNEKGVNTPLWAPSALMAIARYYHLETDVQLVKLIHEMLATIVAREIVPVMTDVAVGYNGAPVTEIAVNRKERIFVGRYPDADGNPGPFRHLTGEIAEINTKDWVVLKM